jgi:hypothetical protein
LCGLALALLLAACASMRGEAPMDRAELIAAVNELFKIDGGEIQRIDVVMRNARQGASSVGRRAELR